jgi:general stress protein 26
MKITEAVADFLKSQDFVIVSSFDKDGFPHNSCKAIVKIDPAAGTIYLIDVYHGITGDNIKRNPRVSVSAVDEHKFIGYCLKGLASIELSGEIGREMIRIWEEKITSRLAKRLLKNISQDKGQKHHPEANLPYPKYLIVMKVERVVDLAPQHLKKGGLDG